MASIPWVKEKIGMVETPHLGMEHQSMVAYGNKFRYTKLGGHDFDWLMHHEFGHEWWGNKMTAKDWADYWIHEGICTFGDELAYKEFAGERAYIDQFKSMAPRFENKIPVVMGKDIDEEAAYNPDIYGKGAFFMHTICYIMGDSTFFPALKMFVTSPNYTYDNLVSTADIEQFFSEESGRDLKPLFDLYLRTIDKLEVHIKQKSNNTYLVQLQNMSIVLPVDITVDGVSKRMNIDSKGVILKSNSLPVIDKDMYYLKKITID